MKIHVHNLAKDTHLEEVRGIFEPYGEITSITLSTEGNPNNVEAIVAMTVSKTTAEVIADHWNNKLWKGHKLKVTANLFFTGEQYK